MKQQMIIIIIIICIGLITGFYLAENLNNVNVNNHSKNTLSDDTWATYISYQEGIQISYPSNWTLITIRVGSPVETNIQSLTLDDEIVLYSPDRLGAIMISGIDYEESNNKISDEKFDELLYKSTIANLADNMVVKKDPKEYIINNYTSRRAFINATSNGDPVIINAYFIKSNNITYFVSFISLDASISHLETATNIINTFETLHDGMKWY